MVVELEFSPKAIGKVTFWMDEGVKGLREVYQERGGCLKVGLGETLVASARGWLTSFRVEQHRGHEAVFVSHKNARGELPKLIGDGCNFGPQETEVGFLVEELEQRNVRGTFMEGILYTLRAAVES